MRSIPAMGSWRKMPGLARACAENGITFVGPDASLLETFGDKTAAKRLAKQTNVPTLPGTEHGLSDPKQVQAAAQEIGYPVIIKASFGGGGRGMRVVKDPADLHAATRRGPARSRRGLRARRSLRRALRRPRQAHRSADPWRSARQPGPPLGTRLLGAAAAPEGGRDRAEHRSAARSAQARSARRPSGFAKAPTTSMPERSSFCSIWIASEFFFIEVNPRIQVEHTVTEVVTGVDLVKSQILVAQGHKLHEAPLNIPAAGQDRDARLRDAVPDHHRRPGKPFHPRLRPDHHLSLARRICRAARRRQRLWRRGHHALLRFAAGEDHHVGHDASRNRSIAWTARLREFRIRGVKTNIPFLENLLHSPQFQSGDATTTFIDNTPELFRFSPGAIAPPRSSAIWAM